MKKVISLLVHRLSQALLEMIFRTFYNNSKRVLLVALITFCCSNNLLADYTINAGVTANPATIPALLNASGTINIYGTMAINSNVTFTSASPLTIYIYGNNGQIIWNSNNTLALPAGSTITYVNNPSAPPGLVFGGPQSASKILQIGSIKYAAANDNSSNVVFSFDQINSIGGTATIDASTGTPSVCYGSPASLSANEKLPAGTNYYIQWASVSGSFSDNNTVSASTATVNGIPAGQDTIYCTLYANSGGSNYFPIGTDTVFITVKSTPVAPTASVTQPTCSTATGTITVTVQTAGETYSFDNGATFQASNSKSGLAAGSYNVIIKSTGGCNSSATAKTVNAQPATPTAPVTSVTQPTCAVATGTITVTVQTAGETYSFDNGATFQASNSKSGLASGSYNIIIKSTGGCNSSATAKTVNAQPATPVQPTLGTVTQPTCATATGSFTITNYSASYTYAATPSAGVTISGSTVTAPAGTYTISATLGSCTSVASASKTVNAQPATPVISAGNNGPVCAGSPVTLSSTSLPGATYAWSGPNGFSTTQQNPSIIYTAAYAGTFTVTVTSSAGCSASASTSVISNGVTGLWTGNISSNWGNADNWCNDILPVISTNVTIPSAVANFPVVGDDQYCNDLLINTGASLNVSNSGNLHILGNITNDGVFNATSGTIEMKSAAAQTIPANTFVNNALNNLIISNSSAAGVTLNGPLDIYGSLTYTGSGRLFITNDFLTIKSTAAATGWVGDITGNTITGKVTVERYIAAHKAWHFLSVPTNTTLTVKQTWQEGAASQGLNPVAGFGTQLTSNRSTWALDGFDTISVSPSVKKYNAITNAWVGIANTNALGIKATDGYFIFIRGDRLATSLNSPATQTVLRTKGPLYVGDQLAIAVAASQFAAIGNPYASALDMRNITKTGLKDFFYLWDPKLSGFYGYGAYQTFSNDGSGNYVVTPGSGSYDSSGAVSNYIKSGLAFFVQATPTGGSLTFKEAAKSNSGGQVNTPASLPWPALRTNIYGINADKSTYMSDGILINYSDNFSNGIDDMDALKSYNTSENLSIKSNNILLAVERRHNIVNTDTIFLNLTGVKIQSYRFEVIATSLYHPGITGFLEDAYLHTSTPLNIDGTTLMDFAIVNVSGSHATNRFRIVFKQQGLLPVTFTSLQAYPKNEDIDVAWKVENESNISHYEVEKSIDGSLFNTLTSSPATANGGRTASYQITDVKPVDGYNYYRVKSVDINGKIAYSAVVKVLINKADPQITVHLNHIIDGRINLQFINQQAGTYFARLTNTLGQVIIDKEINHAGGSNNYELQLKTAVSHGVYLLEIIKNNAPLQTIKVLY